MLSPRVNGGDITVPGAYPFMARLFIDDHWGDCGGSILTPLFILTAAHCLRKAVPLRRYTVIAGDYDLAEYNKSEIEQKRSIAKVFIHPSYNSENLNFDAALVLLSKPLIFNESVATINLRSRADFDNKNFEGILKIIILNILKCSS